MKTKFILRNAVLAVLFVSCKPDEPVEPKEQCLKQNLHR